MQRSILLTVMLLSLLCLYPIKANAQKDVHLFTDAFMTLLSPHIDNAVTGYYGELTQYDLFDADIVKLERTNKDGNDRTFSFQVVVRIMPFEGAHNIIGIDILTLDIDPNGVKVIHYVHEKAK